MSFSTPTIRKFFREQFCGDNPIRVEFDQLSEWEMKIRDHLKVSYIYEFQEPPEEEWGPIITCLVNRFPSGKMSRNTIRDVFKSVQKGEEPIRKEGSEL